MTYNESDLNKILNKDNSLLQDDNEINDSTFSSSIVNVNSSTNDTNNNKSFIIESTSISSESSEDDEFESPSRESYENRYFELSTNILLDFLSTSDQPNVSSFDAVSLLIYKATCLIVVLCLIFSICGAFYLRLEFGLDLWFINLSWTKLYSSCALFLGYCLYRLNSSSFRDTFNVIKFGMFVIITIQLFMFQLSIPLSDVRAHQSLQLFVVVGPFVISLFFLTFAGKVFDAHQEDQRASLREDRENSKKLAYDRFIETRQSYLQTISDQLRQTTDMSKNILKQLSPPHFLFKPHEQLSACSIPIPTVSISAIYNILRDIDYISTHLGTFSFLLHSGNLDQETSHVKQEFDIGETIQHIGDVLAGDMCKAKVELVIYHVDYGLNHLNVIGDRASFSHAILDLGLQIRSSDESEVTEKERSINPHDRVTCMIEIVHIAGVNLSKKSNHNKPVIPNANLTHKLLRFLGADIKMESEENSQRLEITIELEAGSPLAPPNVPNVNEEIRRRYPHLRITGEPSMEELIKTSRNMRGQRVALHATSKSYFAQRITSCLTTWGTDVSHVPIGGEEGLETPQSITPLDSGAGTPQPSEDHQNHDDLQQSSSANLPPTFIIIDDDIDTLKKQLYQLQKVPFPLKVRQRHESTSSSSSQTTAVIHFTSLANYKSVKDAVQYINSSPPTTCCLSLPQVLVIPKPAGPRRFLTALHTTINKIVVDPVYMPIATSPMSPGKQYSNSINLDEATNAGHGVTGITNGIMGKSSGVKQPTSPPPPSPSSTSVKNQTGPRRKHLKSRKKQNNADTVIPPINVLIVEDNPINQTILSTFMRKKKIQYECASNGKEAVEKWQTGGFHLVLMDIQLPVMDGIEATKTIRRLEKSQKIGVFPSAQSSASTSAASSVSSTPATTPMQQPLPPTADLPVIIVALTASSLSSDRQNALAAGCNDFLTKPVSLEWLEKKIREWGCMQALIDFDGWKKKWKRNGDEQGIKDKKTESASVIGKKNNNSDNPRKDGDNLPKYSKQKQTQDDNSSTREINNTDNNKTTASNGTMSLIQPIVIKPSVPVMKSQSNTKESIIESNVEYNKRNVICTISTANNLKNNLINNNLLTLTTTPISSTTNPTNESSSQPSTPLSTSSPPNILRKRGNTVSSVTSVNMSVSNQSDNK
ncbi:12040_t:CDS:2 [Funneliformis mosseae]|uniref:12040_t:CDS:1 n=1 Tax=Funneliformis mosseae TaxID=27381 RepID=A0A9N9EWY4_FUNMO|nr:12040_t:CDS:2 [Funneliformis mosseae]